MFARNFEKVRETAIKCISRSRRTIVRFGKNSESFLSDISATVVDFDVILSLGTVRGIQDVERGGDVPP